MCEVLPLFSNIRGINRVWCFHQFCWICISYYFAFMESIEWSNIPSELVSLPRRAILLFIPKAWSIRRWNCTRNQDLTTKKVRLCFGQMRHGWLHCGDRVREDRGPLKSVLACISQSKLPVHDFHCDTLAIEPVRLRAAQTKPWLCRSHGEHG